MLLNGVESCLKSFLRLLNVYLICVVSMQAQNSWNGSVAGGYGFMYYLNHDSRTVYLHICLMASS